MNPVQKLFVTAVGAAAFSGYVSAASDPAEQEPAGARPAGQSGQWSKERIAALLPAPLDGWTVEDVAIEKLDTITSGFESFALAPLAETATAGVSVRLKTTRAYRSGDHTITVSIDTEDIEAAAMVNAVDAVSGAEGGGPEELAAYAAYGEELLAAGVTALSHDGYPGVSAETDGEAFRSFKIGSAGAVLLECAYAGCEADLDLMLERMDFAAIADFVAFDHRRSNYNKPSETPPETLASRGYDALQRGEDTLAVRLWRQAAEKENADAQNNLGWAYENGRGVAQNDVEAVRWYRLAAEQDHALAQYNLGWMYENGRGVEQSDVEAARWYRLAAEQDHALAQYNLGVMYLFGRGLSQNSTEAARLFRLAAEQGEASAQKNLGLMYKNGDGVGQSDVEAVQWFRRAAEQEYGAAQFSLGLMYEEGRGVERSLDEAVRWYRKAAANGDEDAQEALKHLGASS